MPVRLTVEECKLVGCSGGSVEHTFDEGFGGRHGENSDRKGEHALDLYEQIGAA